MGIEITAAQLYTVDGQVCVALEIDGIWVPVIKHNCDTAANIISHIVEDTGIRECQKEESAIKIKRTPPY